MKKQILALAVSAIAAGAAILENFAWVLYLFAAFLVFTGVRMWMAADHEPDMNDSVLLKFLRKHLRITPQLEGNAFVVTRPDPATGRRRRVPVRLLVTSRGEVPEPLVRMPHQPTERKQLRCRSSGRSRLSSKPTTTVWDSICCWHS